MTAKTAPARPDRERTKAEKALARYAAALAVIVLASLALRSLLLAALGVLALLAFAVWRLRKANARRRAGGKSAMRHRARFQGHATLPEIRRNLSRRQGVPIGTVRSTR